MFRRLGNIIRGFLGLFVSGLERKNPQALLEVEKENLRKQIGQYNQGLASHAGLVEREIVGPLEQLAGEADAKVRRETAATRVNFFTMVRGED